MLEASCSAADAIDVLNPRKKNGGEQAKALPAA